MPAQKILYILRHAKAETGAPGQEDHERALTPRGIEAARHMGEYLARRGIKPQHVLCSTARRTRETWEQIAPFLFPSPIRGEAGRGARNGMAEQASPHPNPPPNGEGICTTDKLYLASPNEIITLLQSTPESVQRLLIVGHNPGLHQLCLTLAASGSDHLLEEVALTFPTCAFAAIALDTPWHMLVPGTLTEFMTPAMLAVTEEE